MDISTALNVAVGIALIVLAFSMAMLTYRIMPLLNQVGLTVLSLQKLSETMEKEIVPTMTELRAVMDGINQLKSITTQRVQDVGNKAEALTGSVTTLVTTAKKESTVAGAGVLAGLKAYLFTRNESRSGEKSLKSNLFPQEEAAASKT